MSLLPFDFQNVEVVSEHEIIYQDVKFTKAFGIFELGTEYDEVSINLQTGEMISYDMHGDEDDKQKFVLAPEVEGG